MLNLFINSIEFLIMKTQSQSDNIFLKKVKALASHIKRNNYMMAYSAEIDLTYATIFFLIRQLQVISILGLPEK